MSHILNFPRSYRKFRQDDALKFEFLFLEENSQGHFEEFSLESSLTVTNHDSRFPFSVVISGQNRFRKLTSGCSGYHQNVQNLISVGFSYKKWYLGVIGPPGQARFVTVN